jgi:hypothetical protein
MAFFSLVIPAIRGYLNVKANALTCGWCRSSEKICFILFWLIAVMGAFFALSGGWEYLSSNYTSVRAKSYMALACFTLSIGGGISYFFIKGVLSFFQRSKVPETDSFEQRAKNIVKLIQSDGVELIKHHPFAALLIGVSVGLLSGMTPLSKEK